MTISSNEQLFELLSQDNVFKYLYFWGHQNKNNQITKSCFSQWYHSPFEEDGTLYLTAEHYMMHAKAILFNALAIANKVLLAKTPGEAKALGRKIQGFNEELWLKHRFDIVVKANLAKFSYHLELKDFLLNTGERILVEASPVDAIWGIGLASDNPAVENPTKWQGLNLLGYALMAVRDKLSKK